MSPGLNFGCLDSITCASTWPSESAGTGVSRSSNNDACILLRARVWVATQVIDSARATLACTGLQSFQRVFEPAPTKPRSRSTVTTTSTRCIPSTDPSALMANA